MKPSRPPPARPPRQCRKSCNATEQITSSRYRKIQQRLAQGIPVPRLATEMGLSESTVSKVRGRLALRVHEDAYCPVCRCQVFPPCQRCRVLFFRRYGYDPMPRWRCQLRRGADWETICCRDLIVGKTGQPFVRAARQQATLVDNLN